MPSLCRPCVEIVLQWQVLFIQGGFKEHYRLFKTTRDGPRRRRRVYEKAGPDAQFLRNQNVTLSRCVQSMLPLRHTMFAVSSFQQELHFLWLAFSRIHGAQVASFTPDMCDMLRHLFCAYNLPLLANNTPK